MAPRPVIQPILVVIQPLIVRLAMTLEEQKILERFIRLGPPRFSSVVGENGHAFLVS